MWVKIRLPHMYCLFSYTGLMWIPHEKIVISPHTYFPYYPYHFTLHPYFSHFLYMLPNFFLVVEQYTFPIHSRIAQNSIFTHDSHFVIHKIPLVYKINLIRTAQAVFFSAWPTTQKSLPTPAVRGCTKHMCQFFYKLVLIITVYINRCAL